MEWALELDKEIQGLRHNGQRACYVLAVQGFLRTIIPHWEIMDRKAALKLVNKC
jgi:hypothetical protein